MFLLFALLSTLGYTLQSTLMVRFFRAHDPLHVTAIRGIALGLSMSPLLLWVDDFSCWQQASFLLMVLSAGFLTALAVWSGGTALRHLPVGICIALQQSFGIVFVSIFEFMILRQQLSLTQYLLIALLIALNIFISIDQRSSAKIKDDADRQRRPLWGSALAIFFALCVALSYLLLTQTSRNTDPYATAYTWELSIGIWAYLFLFIKNKVRPPSIDAKPLISIKTKIGIFFSSWPTLLGTGFYMLCVTISAPSIVNAINSTQILGCILLSRLLYQEELKGRQIACILVATVLVIFLSL